MALQTELIHLVQRLSFCQSVEAILARLRESARKLTGADGLTIVLREGELCHYVEEDAIAPLWKGRRFPMEACISGWCMLNRQQAAIPDIYSDTRIPHEAYRPTFVKSLVMTPIRSEDPVGAIGVYWALPHQASTGELQVVQAIADSAALALSNVRMLEELHQASRRKDEFLAMLSHELRNPLAPLANALELLRLNGQHDEVAFRKAQAIMERQVHRLTHIVNDLLDTARIRSGKAALQLERLDLSRHVRQDLEDRRALLEQAGLALESDLPETPVLVRADPLRMTQILGNLLENAQKFTPPGGRVEVRLLDEPDGHAVLTVRDTGIGIPPKILPEIFDAFTQADQTLDRTAGGLGLGLSVVRGLVELHGGTIEVASAGLGQGAEFKVRLPRETLAVPFDDRLGRSELPEREDLPEADLCRKILIVEDNLDSAETLRDLLEVWGYDVTLVHTGPEAVTVAKALRPDAVLCDIGLPDMDGFTIASLLRQAPETAGARLIAVTGYGQDEDRRHGLDSGFDAYLIKPVDLETLRSELQEFPSNAAGRIPRNTLDLPV